MPLAFRVLVVQYVRRVRVPVGGWVPSADRNRSGVDVFGHKVAVGARDLLATPTMMSGTPRKYKPTVRAVPFAEKSRVIRLMGYRRPLLGRGRFVFDGMLCSW